MTTIQQSCPTCGGKAVNRGEFWETTWAPVNIAPSESARIAHERANKVGRHNIGLRQALRQIFIGAAEASDGLAYSEIATIADKALRASAADPGPGRALDREDLLVPATRYYMGRRTIGVTAHCEALAAAWLELPKGVKDTIRRDLEDAFRRDDAMRADPVCSTSYYPLGADIDRRAWEFVRSAWLADSSNEVRT